MQLLLGAIVQGAAIEIAAIGFGVGHPVPLLQLGVGSVRSFTVDPGAASRSGGRSGCVVAPRSGTWPLSPRSGTAAVCRWVRRLSGAYRAIVTSALTTATVRAVPTSDDHRRPHQHPSAVLAVPRAAVRVSEVVRVATPRGMGSEPEARVSDLSRGGAGGTDQEATAQRASHIRLVLPPAERPNERWSIDLVTDRLESGRPFRVLTVVDQCNLE